MNYWYCVRHEKMPSRLNRRARMRRGTTLIELIVAAILLMTIMTFMTSLCCRIHLIWHDIGHHRIAVNELSNQLEWLTLLPVDKAEETIKSLSPSPACQRTLNHPQLSGQLVEDELGTRVELQINWDRRHPSKPVQLTGWIVEGS